MRSLLTTERSQRTSANNSFNRGVTHDATASQDWSGVKSVGSGGSRHFGDLAFRPLRVALEARHTLRLCFSAL
ncbi:hypothetical protein GN956_G11618 [Arapaima gigas]